MGACLQDILRSHPTLSGIPHGKPAHWYDQLLQGHLPQEAAQRVQPPQDSQDRMHFGMSGLESDSDAEPSKSVEEKRRRVEEHLSHTCAFAVENTAVNAIEGNLASSLEELLEADFQDLFEGYVSESEEGELADVDEACGIQTGADTVEEGGAPDPLAPATTLTLKPFKWSVFTVTPKSAKQSPPHGGF